MGKTSMTMNPDKTQEANPEQLLKLLELQVEEARGRRAAREAGRGKAGTIGLVLIIGGAAIALWMLMVLLEQMRPQRGEANGRGAAQPAESAR
jgi:hypothetical protein